MKAPLPDPEIITRRGKPVAVILPIKAYEEILERLEEVDDLTYLRKARRKPLQYRPLQEVLADLGKE